MSTTTYRYTRRTTHLVTVGALTIGGDATIVPQSMANVDTNNVEEGVAQTLRIVAAGGALVRFTAQGVREAKALRSIREQLTAQGCHAPLSADIHFNPKAAFEAAQHVEKVRINPGNFYDPARQFKIIEYNDADYRAEVEGLQSAFTTFLDHCREHHTALRIGVNHGSLSDRIMSRYGDTPEGMVESCMEFLEVCRREHFDDVVISIKSSNVVVMTQTVRLLCDRMEACGMSYPLHLGVTEAGEGEDGRIKSATGIGALLSEGIGDTIRVSLSEEPEEEIPVCRTLIDCVREQAAAPAIEAPRRDLAPLTSTLPRVVAYADPSLNDLPADARPDLLLLPQGVSVSDYPDYRCLSMSEVAFVTDRDLIAHPDQLYDIPLHHLVVLQITHSDKPNMLQAVAHLATRPYIIGIASDAPKHEVAIRLGYYLGSALLRGEGSGLLLDTPTLTPQESVRLAFGLLQSTRRRITRTEYISCPGCGRTLFDLQETVARVKAATQHLKRLKIGVMGCIVNGPGEMADADYGYVGSSPGMIDLYKGKECKAHKIPQEEAVERLISLIRECGDWHDPK